jgi:cyclopropane-fatty-acyl-phospholipid synthase
MLAENLLERGLIPDALVRFAIRGLLRERLKLELRSERGALLEAMRSSEIAVSTDAANSQHYEVPAEFFAKVLGPRMKYSCALFEAPDDTLAEAEERMLRLTCERAALADGQRVLELGCGWGSLTLWIAERFPRSRVLGVSNSASQREFILARAAERGLGNVEVVTCDMNHFDPGRTFDRVVSVEMFEHMRNLELLLSRIARWLEPEGRLFVHIFTHRKHAYLFEDRDRTDWMARHFFTGGMMPSHSLLGGVASGFAIEQDWVVPGEHYSRTSEHWLSNMDRSEREIRRIFARTYGSGAESLWWNRWRVFFMACAELWGFRGGTEWQVSHYLLRKTVP